MKNFYGKMGYVYLLADYNNTGVYKIGVTTGKIENRIKKLQTGNCGEIYLWAYHQTNIPFFIETRLHFLYHGSKVKNEWFSLTLEEANRFNEMCEEQERFADAMSDNVFLMEKMR